jgi:hypothetical protein
MANEIGTAFQESPAHSRKANYSQETPGKSRSLQETSFQDQLYRYRKGNYSTYRSIIIKATWKETTHPFQVSPSTKSQHYNSWLQGRKPPSHFRDLHHCGSKISVYT